MSGLEKQVAISFQQKNIKLETKLETSLQYIECGKTYIEIALVNILLNACKHSNEGGKIEFRIYKNIDKICFSIKDYGEGIPEKALPAIFETFYRADSSRNRATGGVGIGLSLAKALVDIHQGSIKVISKEGKAPPLRWSCLLLVKLRKLLSIFLFDPRSNVFDLIIFPFFTNSLL